MTDDLTRLLKALDDTGPGPRTPSTNHPFQPAYTRTPRGVRPEKWGRPAYRDPVGDTATGNVRREQKQRKPR